MVLGLVYPNWSNSGNFGKILWMKPVLFTIGALPISSFGFFLVLACLAATYIIWRIIRVYDFDEERFLDLILLTLVGALISSRLFFVIFHLDQFQEPLKVVLLNRYPGFSFWGGFFGAFMMLKLLSLRFKLEFWQVADLIIPGVFLGISVATVGCLLGSCEYGLAINLPFSITQAGLIEKRFPVQIVESLLFFLGFIYLWKGALRFHPNGATAAEGLLMLGIFKFLLEFFYGNRQWIGPIPVGILSSTLVIIYSLRIFYVVNKHSPLTDLRRLKTFFKSASTRQKVISNVHKNWYNFKVGLSVAFGRGCKKLLRFLNIKPNPPQF